MNVVKSDLSLWARGGWESMWKLQQLFFTHARLRSEANWLSIFLLFLSIYMSIFLSIYLFIYLSNLPPYLLFWIYRLKFTLFAVFHEFRQMHSHVTTTTIRRLIFLLFSWHLGLGNCPQYRVWNSRQQDIPSLFIWSVITNDRREIILGGF